MCDSSFELEIERVNSESEKKSHDNVPDDMKYTFKLKNEEGKSYSLLEYPLKKGKSLPYTVELKGLLSNVVHRLEKSFLFRQECCLW